jgi:type I restriction enzyme S subunit
MAKWNYAKIGDVCTVERGGSPRPIDKFITNAPDGINWIKIGDTTDSMYITETAQTGRVGQSTICRIVW